MLPPRILCDTCLQHEYQQLFVTSYTLLSYKTCSTSKVFIDRLLRHGELETSASVILKRAEVLSEELIARFGVGYTVKCPMRESRDLNIPHPVILGKTRLPCNLGELLSSGLPRALRGIHVNRFATLQKLVSLCPECAKRTAVSLVDEFINDMLAYGETFQEVF